MKNRLEQIIKVKLDMSKINSNSFAPLERGKDDPCWEGYIQVGTKEVNGKIVPNCVPMEAKKVDFADYPWDKCIEDQIKAYGDEETAKKVCGAIKAGMRKEDFVIPSPEGGESENDYMSRCISAIYDEYGKEQSAAICYSKWREK